MALRNYLNNDFKYTVFSELYSQIGDRKSNRSAFQILESAVDNMAKKGSAKITLSNAAKSSGFSPSQVCYYFKDLETLKLSTIKYVRLLYQSYVIEKTSAAENFEDALSEYFEACFIWPKYFPKHSSVWLAFLHNANTDKTYRQLNTQAVEAGLRRLEGLILSGVKARVFKCSDPAATAYIIHQLTTAHILTEATEFHDEDSVRHKRSSLKTYCFQLLGSPRT